MQAGKRVTSVNIQINDSEEIEILASDKFYTYLGLEVGNEIEQKKAKNRLKNEHMWRIKKILKTELYAKREIDSINSFATPVLVEQWNKATGY